MSSFSNTDTGSKPADPYTEKNLQEPSLKEKIDDLAAFVDRAKFCMMTTQSPEGLLVSRCMALAARVSELQSIGIGSIGAATAFLPQNPNFAINIC